MRIYTVTFLNKNYGSILQAYALQNVLKNMGANPVILQQKGKAAKKSSAVKRIKAFLKPQKNYGYYRRLMLRVTDKRFTEKYNRIAEFKKNSLSVEYVGEIKEAVQKVGGNDILLAGSDQIWSVINRPLSEWYTLNWEGLPAQTKKYSYAASIGLSELTEDQKKQYQAALKDFSVVSFREKQAKTLLSSYLSQEVRCDLDPTLLCDGEFWGSVSSERKVKEPYLFIYMIRPDKRLIKMGKKLGKQLNCKVIYTGLMAGRFKGVTTVCDAGAEDFLSYIQHAEGVLTNSFHGTVFSILFGKKFASVKISSTSSRAENLLNITGLENHYISDESGLEVFHEDIDYDTVYERLDEERRKSLAYLQQICKEEE